MMWREVEEIQQNTLKEYRKFYKYTKNLTKELNQEIYMYWMGIENCYLKRLER
jgi:hypothetical protein